jgi:uncharacterized protein YbaR (Trm112 family)
MYKAGFRELLRAIAGKRRPERTPQARSRKAKYGVTDADYMRMVRLQGGRCPICREQVELVVDHDHATGRFRGLLCNNCNVALGMLQDSPTLLRRAYWYMRKVW